jgi:hypothetical protein
MSVALKPDDVVVPDQVVDGSNNITLAYHAPQFSISVLIRWRLGSN